MNSDGKTTFNVGYILPKDEIPESLQIELYPAQSVTVASSDDVQLFYVNLLGADPSQKSALIKVVTLSGLSEMLRESSTQ